MEKKKLFTSKVNLELKKRIMKCLVCSVALYAAETWTDSDSQKIRFAMWIWRTMGKIASLIKLLIKKFSKD